MDRALLERMIGAIALLLLLVIVAPAVLDGSRESGLDRLSNAQDDQDVRTQIIVLNEPDDPEAWQEPKSAAESLQSGAVVANKPESSAKAKELPVVVESTVTVTPSAAPVAAPAPAKAVAPTATPSSEVATSASAVVSRPVTGDPPKLTVAPEKVETPFAAADAVKAAGFAVQLGSFGQAENARKYAAELSNKGFAAFVRSGSTATGTIHRVYAGPRPSRDAAEQLASVLGSAGYRGIVVDLSAGNGKR